MKPFAQHSIKLKHWDVFLFWTILVLGSGLRGVIAWKFQTRAWIDEIWVVLSPAYQLLTGVGTLQGDWSFGIRSIIPPGLVFLWLKFLSTLGLVSKSAVSVPEQVSGNILGGTLALPLTRVMISLLGSFGFLAFLISLKKELKLAREPVLTALVLFLTPELLHYAGIADLSVLALPFLLFGLLFFTKRKVYLAFAFLFFASIIRYQYGLISLLLWFGLWHKSVDEKTKPSSNRFHTAFFVLVIGLLFLFFDVALNSLFYGRFVFPAFNYLYQNTFAGMAASYGTTPFYFAFELLWRFVTEPVFALILLTTWLSFKKTTLLSLICFSFFAVHAFVGHKEYRFFYGPAVLLAGLSTATFESWLQISLINNLKRQRAKRIWVLSCLVLFLCTFSSFAIYRALKKTSWADYVIPSQLETIAGAQANLKGLITYGWGGIYSGSNYTLFRPLPYLSAETLSEVKGRKLNPDHYNYVITGSNNPKPCQNIIKQTSGASLFYCTREEMHALLRQDYHQD